MALVDSTTNGQAKTGEVQPAKKPKIMPTDEVVLEFAKLSENAYTPTRGSKYAAGYDLYRYGHVDVVVVVVCGSVHLDRP